jgi:hypothetical protein
MALSDILKMPKIQSALILLLLISFLISPAEAALPRMARRRLLRRMDIEEPGSVEEPGSDEVPHHGPHHGHHREDRINKRHEEPSSISKIGKRYLVRRNGDDWTVEDIPA